MIPWAARNRIRLEKRDPPPARKLTCHTEPWRTHRPDRHTARNQSRASDTEPASPSTRRATASDLPDTPSVSRMSDTQPTHDSPMIYDLPRNKPPNQHQTFDAKFRGATHKSRSAGPCMSFNIIRSRYVVHPSLSQKWFQLAQPIKLPVHEWLARRRGVGEERDIVVSDGQRTERSAPYAISWAQTSVKLRSCAIKTGVTNVKHVFSIPSRAQARRISPPFARPRRRCVGAPELTTVRERRRQDERIVYPPRIRRRQILRDADIPRDIR